MDYWSVGNERIRCWGYDKGLDGHILPVLLTTSKGYWDGLLHLKINHQGPDQGR